MGVEVEERVDVWERTLRELDEMPEPSQVLVVHTNGVRREILVFQEAAEARDLVEHLAANGYDARLEPRRPARALPGAG